jgi:excisionase family DNA binding protein
MDNGLKEPLTSQSQPDFEPLLNDDQAAKFLGGIHRTTLQRMAKTGKIPAYRVGRFWRYRASELNQCLQVQSTPPNHSRDLGKERTCNSREFVISKVV